MTAGRMSKFFLMIWTSSSEDLADVPYVSTKSESETGASEVAASFVS